MPAFKPHIIEASIAGVRHRASTDVFGSSTSSGGAGSNADAQQS